MTPITTDKTRTARTGELGAHLAPEQPLRQAARALAGVVARSGRRIEVDVQGLLDPLPAASSEEWSGYLPWRGGWLGIALPDAASHDLFEALKKRPGTQGLPAKDAARLFQSFGIAALSAWPAACPAEPVPGRRGGTGAPVLRRTDGDRALLVGGRVIDMGRLIAAPLAGRILEELGAEVIRVRPPGTAAAEPCDFRLDLGSAADRGLLADLAAGADLLVENSGEAAGERLTSLLAARPPRRRVSIRGFEPVSRRRYWRAYGFLIEAAMRCGYAPFAGARGAVPASRVPVLDRTTGLLAAAHALDCLLGAGPAHRTLALAQVARAITHNVLLTT